jgi:1-acyl-sn-glycerol-3-phosphate acyltransferase
MDNAIIHGFINKRKGFVSIIEVLRFPILRTWMKYMKCVFLDRKDIRQTYKCIEKGISLLKEGHSMVIFPEGKLNSGGEVAEFQNGCLRMALKAGVPIVPITLKDSYRVMTKNGSRIRAAKVECIISKPLSTTNITKEEEKEYVKTVREIIISNL